MLRILAASLLLIPACAPLTASAYSSPPALSSLLHSTRTDAGDLEVGGELTGLPSGTTRYIAYQDLLRLPQKTYTVSDDANFKVTTEISGVALADLAKILGQNPAGDLVVAICYDKYRTNYSRQYISLHQPLLVLRINGKLRDQWPSSEHGGPLGPYLISHPTFTPSFQILAHKDEPQIPFGVTRIELRKESRVFGAIRPPGNWPPNSTVGMGYRIVQQNCFRCHNMGPEGGELAGRSWYILAAWAATNPTNFKQYVKDPTSLVPSATMPPMSDYDDKTLTALADYFRTFIPQAHTKPSSERKTK